MSRALQPCRVIVRRVAARRRILRWRELRTVYTGKLPK